MTGILCGWAKKKLIYCWKIALDFRSLAKKSNLPKPNASEIKARYIIFIPVYAFLEAELRLTRILLNIYTEQWQCSGFHKCTAVDHLHTIKTPFFAMQCETEKNFPCFHRGHAIRFQTEGKYSILFTIIIWSSCGHSTGHRIYRKWKQLGQNSLSRAYAAPSAYYRSSNLVATYTTHMDTILLSIHKYFRAVAYELTLNGWNSIVYVLAKRYLMRF